MLGFMAAYSLSQMLHISSLFRHRVNSFMSILQVSQFHTDLSLFDLNGKEVMRKTISVNDPLRYGGITIYQTDWGFSALQVTKNGEGPFNLAVAPLQINGDKKLYGTFLPVGDDDSSSVKGMYVNFLPCCIFCQGDNQ